MSEGVGIGAVSCGSVLAYMKVSASRVNQVHVSKVSSVGSSLEAQSSICVSQPVLSGSSSCCNMLTILLM